MPKKLSSEFQNHSIKIEDFNISPINPFNHISTEGGVKTLSLLLGMSYIMLKKLSSEFQNHSIKI